MRLTWCWKREERGEGAEGGDGAKIKDGEERERGLGMREERRETKGKRQGWEGRGGEVRIEPRPL